MEQFSGAAREFASCRTLDGFVCSEFFATPGPDRLFLPQTSWITGADGSLAVDSILRLESIETDVPRLLRWIGVPSALVDKVQVPRVNATRHSHTAAALSSTSLDRIRQRYAEDFVRLGYEPPQ
jgi:hypothetical protein